ncbi:MAG: hypothetical protein AABY11_02245 [archaeon]
MYGRRLRRVIHQIWGNFGLWYEAYHGDRLSSGKGNKPLKMNGKTPESTDEINDPWIRIGKDGLGGGERVRFSSLPKDQQRILREAWKKRREGGK